MKAIRVHKRGKGNLHTIHWLTDEDGTRCGREAADLDVVEELDLLELPPLEACRLCQRAGGDVDAIAKRDPPEHYYREVLPATLGRSSKAGPLRHTGRSGHGHRIR